MTDQLTSKQLDELARPCWSFDHHSFDHISYARSVLFAAGVPESPQQGAEPSEAWLTKAIKLIDEYASARHAKVSSATDAMIAHLRAALPVTRSAPAALYDVVPPSAAEWFADSPGIANADWRGGWDACRTRCRTLLDEHIAAGASVEAIATTARPVDLEGGNRLHTALSAPGCERLRDFFDVGPVQRAAVESFADALAAGVTEDAP